jgi:hypothetical protein
VAPRDDRRPADAGDPARRGRGDRRRGHGPPARDDPDARERARDLLQRELDRGADLEDAARAALRVSEECAEAWLLLADAARSPDEARSRVRRAVAVATAALGSARLADERGRLADTPDGVAYLHALAALARAQVAEERGPQAVSTLEHVLAADPRDPVAVRGDLLLLLLATGRDDEADELVAAYADEANADWSFGRALLRRRRATDAAGLERATAALDRAIARFPDAARAQSGDPTPPTRGPRVDPLLAQAWADTDTALAWLAERLAAPPPAAASAPNATTPEEADRRFSALEHVEEALDLPPDRREHLALRALYLWPDCAAAWRVLADVAADLPTRRARLVEAVAAGCRALRRPPDGPPSPIGDGDDARALLAARDALAGALRASGDEDGALAQERVLLAEDPDDPRGVGLRHVARLFALGRDAEAEAVLAPRAEDASPGWVWARVLAARRKGDRVAASFALSEATMVASFVGPLLLARSGKAPRPDGLSRDAFDACRVAAEVLRPAFEATPGAFDWLATVLPRAPDRSRQRPGP